ncbi:hypothetical protein GALMADRAFT_1248591 [Galerina marginata CBS 339.88]|uniref:Uncharacterized protein n=1 Tax=Galerina marginata (strain CBS 339.88) TaxID=685588 RepID=A0A067S4B7_GALM3|nr:hypothetical protein GALMADRAFT_1248591 [Galerina marginata CBS 339.88]
MESFILLLDCCLMFLLSCGILDLSSLFLLSCCRLNSHCREVLFGGSFGKNFYLRPNLYLGL